MQGVLNELFIAIYLYSIRCLPLWDSMPIYARAVLIGYVITIFYQEEPYAYHASMKQPNAIVLYVMLA